MPHPLHLSRIGSESSTQKLEVSTAIVPSSNAPCPAAPTLPIAPVKSKFGPSSFQAPVPEASVRRNAKDTYREDCQKYLAQLRQAALQIQDLRLERGQLIDAKTKLSNDMAYIQAKSSQEISALQQQLVVAAQNQQFAQYNWSLADCIAQMVSEALGHQLEHIERGLLHNHQELREMLQEIIEAVSKAHETKLK